MKLLIRAQNRNFEHQYTNDFPRVQDRVQRQNLREQDRDIRQAVSSDSASRFLREQEQ